MASFWFLLFLPLVNKLRTFKVPDQFSFFGKLFASKVLNLKNKNKKNIYREGKDDAIDVEVINSDTIK